jgi:hypothetical protein
VGAKGHNKGDSKLDPVGEALARPVIRSSTLPDMLKYTEDLLGITLGPSLTAWQKAYKLRCAAAHNGGRVTAKVLKDIPDIGGPIGSQIVLSWNDLRGYFSHADKIAGEVDRVVATKHARELEAEWLLESWKTQGKLPKKDQIWVQLHELGFAKIDKKTKAAITLKLFGHH